MALGGFAGEDTTITTFSRVDSPFSSWPMISLMSFESMFLESGVHSKFVMEALVPFVFVNSTANRRGDR